MSQAHTTQVTEHLCQSQVWKVYRHILCNKKAKVERNGVWFCGTHDPVSVKEKREKRNAEFMAKFAAEQKAAKERADRKAEMERRAACFDELLEALKKAAEYIAKDMDQHGLWVDHSDFNALEAARAAIAKAEAA